MGLWPGQGLSCLGGNCGGQTAATSRKPLADDGPPGLSQGFEETIMFATPVSVKAVKVLMRGAKPWGYFGLSTVAAVAAPYSFMLR